MISALISLLLMSGSEKMRGGGQRRRGLCTQEDLKSRLNGDHLALRASGTGCYRTGDPGVCSSGVPPVLDAPLPVPECWRAAAAAFFQAGGWMSDKKRSLQTLCEDKRRSLFRSNNTHFSP